MTQEPGSVVLEYIWISGECETRSKIKVFTGPFNNNQLTVDDCPEWDFDGSSTGQADSTNSEIILKPVRLFRILRNSFFVLCDTYYSDGRAHNTNYRLAAKQIFDKHLNEKPWYGLEQEYFMIDNVTGYPLGFTKNDDGKYDAPQQGQYYCSVGSKNAFGRQLAEKHLELCIRTGVKISGINAEVAPGQWEFQIGPCEGIEAGDHLWMARYLLTKVAETHNIHIDFSPKVLKNEWNGSGCHTNFSTLSMREGTETNTGLDVINSAITKLSHKHNKHMEVYGTGNRERMTGIHETSSYDKFTDGIADRGCSIRRGTKTQRDKKGYFEDRRPSSNCDPYRVTSIILDTIME